jgi:hypothetical protein
MIFKKNLNIQMTHLAQLEMITKTIDSCQNISISTIKIYIYALTTFFDSLYHED